MPQRSVVKNLDVPLLKLDSGKHRRRAGEVPYPISYSNQMADFDIWDHMFLKSYCKSLTIHQFTQPPAMALDVGCGSGFWAIEAAKEWPTSRIIGFDLVKIQPNLHAMEHLKSVAQRVEWVHGNFLDGLPFPSGSFDFVRISGLGLAIPEDEWQPILEEINRIMKPGGALEIIEEDSIFPCSSTLLQPPSDSIFPPSPNDHRHPHSLFKSKSTTFYDRSNVSHDQIKLSPIDSSGSHNGSGGFTAKLSTFLPSRSNPSRHSSTSTLVAQSPLPTETAIEPEHPQDHTRLNVAWEAMLSTRFLSPKTVSIIPFYLTSSSFINTQAHAPLIVPLPPNSGTTPSLKLFRSVESLRSTDRFEQYFGGNLFDLAPSRTSRSIKSGGCSARSSVTLTPQPPAPTWGTMHLAKTCSVVRGCKEAIFAEYKELYSAVALHVLLRTAPEDEDYSLQPHKYIVRRAFEVDWRNWELDMMDRMGMRNNLKTHVGWTQPVSEADCPEWSTWRDKLNRKPGSEAKSGHLVTAYNPDDLCRSLRAFTGFKA